MSERQITERVMADWEAKSTSYVQRSHRMSSTVRATVEAFVRLAKIRSGNKVIELGCGHGRAAEALVNLIRDLDYTGVDFTQALLDNFVLTESHMLMKLTLVCADISQLPFGNDEFEVAISTRVFQYLADPFIALCEAKRVLQNGGRAVIAVPNAWNPIKALRHYQRLYSPYDVKAWFEKCGFRDICIESCIFSPWARPWSSPVRVLEMLRSVPGLRLLGGAAIVVGTK